MILFFVIGSNCKLFGSREVLSTVEFHALLSRFEFHALAVWCMSFSTEIFYLWPLWIGKIILSLIQRF